MSADFMFFLFLFLQLLHASGNNELKIGGGQFGNVLQRMCRLCKKNNGKVSNKLGHL